MLHLNLKSANVLLDEHGTAKVSDFGLSVAKAESAVVTSHIGSPQWTAPEALRGQRPGAAADTYSFGMLLYEVFARALPYAGVDANYVHIGLLTRMLPRPAITEDVRRRSPPAAIALLERCWHEEPSARPPFSQIVDELERALDRFLPLGELASGRLNLAPLLDGLGFPNLLVFDGGRLLLDMDGALVIAGRLSLFWENELLYG